MLWVDNNETFGVYSKNRNNIIFHEDKFYYVHSAQYIQSISVLHLKALLDGVVGVDIF